MTHSEEVSFYAGHRREGIILDAKFKAVVKHANTIYLSRLVSSAPLLIHHSFVNDGVLTLCQMVNCHCRLGMGIFDGFLVKYGAVMLGYAVLGMPVFGSGSEEYIKRIGEDKSMIGIYCSSPFISPHLTSVSSVTSHCLHHIRSITLIGTLFVHVV
jgi:hypothetical protein